MRHRKRANKRGGHTSSSGHGWAWLLFGVVLGSVLGSIGYVKWHESRPHTLPPVVAAKTIEKIPKPKFDFYTMLPEVKVEQPRSPSAAPIPKPQPATVANVSKPMHSTNYRLQLASFKSFHEADAMKARLALAGFTVEIQSAKLDNGTVWYRVQTPPLGSQQAALKMQSTLKAEAITSVVVPTNG